MFSAITVSHIKLCLLQQNLILTLNYSPTDIACTFMHTGRGKVLYTSFLTLIFCYVAYVYFSLLICILFLSTSLAFLSCCCNATFFPPGINKTGSYLILALKWAFSKSFDQHMCWVGHFTVKKMYLSVLSSRQTAMETLFLNYLMAFLEWVQESIRTLR